MIDLALYAILILSVLGGLALLLDIARSALRRGPKMRPPRSGPRKAPRRLRPRPVAPVLVDGSNVVMWQKNAGLAQKAQLETLIEVLDQIATEGHPARVIFDATIGYNLAGRFLHEGDLRRMINRPSVSLQVVNKGETADAALLAEAATTGAPIVTNDRYRDHIRPRGLRLRGGGYSRGRIRLKA